MIKYNISVILVVYNEESRIAPLLQCLSWSDDIVLVDKSSTDKTAEIASRYTPTIIHAPYSDTGNENALALAQAKNKWVLVTTASSLIDISLVKKIHQIINDPNFEYDIIALPYKLFALGINSPHSPWHSPHKLYLAKKEVFECRNVVHEEISFRSSKVFYLSEEDTDNGYFYHQTHQSIRSLMERHIRYTQAELVKFDKGRKRDLIRCLYLCTKSLISLIFKRKFFLLGFDGIALALAYMTYPLLTYLFVWEKYNQPSAQEQYQKRAIQIAKKNQKAPTK